VSPEEGIAPATCAVCGADFHIGLHSRCGSCGSFCCRDCLKISYSTDSQARPVVNRVLCYYCYHGIERNS